ncbi:MAG: diaminobutyrate--2-oxoglutarate transaminase [Pseudomonadota bacterium]
MESIARLESEVRGYVRSFPTVFTQSRNAHLWDEQGRQYIDFFAGAGTLNYGHNHPRIKAALLEHIQQDGLLHGLDLATRAKIRFLETFEDVILVPRQLNYRLQFTGPTGTNAIEAAIKVARKAKSRSHVVAFTNAYHGHSLGSLALTGNRRYHNEHYGSHNNVSHLPFDGYFGAGTDTAAQLRKLLQDGSSGLPHPAAIVLETIQAEGGINVASDDWLRAVRAICDDFDIAMIVDDIQVGNGRTGPFFSFETAGIRPDIVCLSKAIGGGLPMSLVLIDPELDVWQPGEHTGTFRGNQLAFVAANAALPLWREDTFTHQLKRNAANVETHLGALAKQHGLPPPRGRGMIWGLCLPNQTSADAVTQACFEHGLIMETAGAEGNVLKFLAPLTIEHDTLLRGLEILEYALQQCAPIHDDTRVAIP